ncbi:ImmA/IrrE family metallo-endopeptidase [Hymenobacter ginsengisoli]|uniref:ImmA/IrrE family metallo-endopeptidase n=1 Tax=Hymenobacter ginsengisoli TaxID=1051626 RepID=A0ABP8PY84_9BACT|nr:MULTISPECIES: ImmA/IrrE family metallo-endopeptidase [unclassified Hymenobacter]MBO2033565.1 ImmA/IrrE family metallo-endopeptidase [Hymenobacter sp. BT559]
MKTAKFDIRPIEAQAEKFRAIHGLGQGLGLNLELLLHQLGVVAVFKPLGSEGALSGMALKQDGERFMLVNSSVARGRQNFTIAHELYHLFVQADFHVRYCHTARFNGQNDPEERNADYFAACLLMPKYRIMQAAADLTPGASLPLSTIVQLEQEFQCSRKAMLMRLVELDYLRPQEQEDYGKNVILSARNLGYPTDLYDNTRPAKREAIGDYLPLSSRLFEQERISETQHATFLHDFALPSGADLDSAADA